MALVTRRATAGVDGVSASRTPALSGDFIAGETLDAAAPVYIRNSDGRVFMSNGTAVNEAAKVHGFTARRCLVGETVTLLAPHTRFGYGSGLARGARLFLGATAGRLDDVATIGDTVGVAFVVNDTDIVFSDHKLV